MSLINAVSQGDVERVKRLLKNSTGRPVKNDRSKTTGVGPLHLAVYKEYVDVVRALVEGGIDVNIRNPDTQRTPLFNVEYHKQDGITYYLLQKGARVDAQDKMGDTILHVILSKAQIRSDRVLTLLVSPFFIGQDVTALWIKNNKGYTPMNMASAHLRGHPNDTHISDRVRRQIVSNVYKGMSQHEKSLLRLLTGLAPQRNVTEIYTRLKNTYNSYGHGTRSKSLKRLGKIVLMACMLSSRDRQIKILCQIIGKEITLTDTPSPFHLLVPLVCDPAFPCWVKNSRDVKSKSRLKPIIEYLLKKGFDINAVEPLSRTTPLSYLQEYLEFMKMDPLERRRLETLKVMFIQNGAEKETLKTYRSWFTPSQNTWMPKKKREYVTEWTTEAYQDIQNKRRGQETVQSKNSGARIDRYIAQHFRNTGLRAPEIPRQFQERPKTVHAPTVPRIQYLYRGIHGPLWTSFKKKNMLHDRGYIAFTRNIHKARDFANGNPVLRLAISNVPAGTPWIWFENAHTVYRRGSNLMRSEATEHEVLLPPGTLRRKKNSKNNHGIDIWDVYYTPNKNATTIQTKKAPQGKYLYRGKKASNSKNTTYENKLSRNFMNLFQSSSQTKKRKPGANGNTGPVKKRPKH
jgi:hypothetical protein